ncbi:MAG: hypothetical protein KDC52_11190 [Ignavibacteriae bacterium]|nr:hypothetical protein [Ignavibacteriota bacterium]MCB0746763.1 hypothetical protein [Ignavibacteriota bacterium]MCB0752030.1 hypothetical protein [Ignavibacteriota bacterium]
MKNDFLCPYCKGKLNVKGNIVLSVHTASNKLGLVFLSPKLGNYETTKHPKFEIKKGEHLDFFCPICHANLAAIEFNENLAKIFMTDENQKVYEIVFSEIAGEHCTYKLVDHMIESYGEHTDNYVNHFGAKSRL